MHIKNAAVIFAADHARLARFYVALTEMVQTHTDADHTVLESAHFQLVLHALRGEPDAAAAGMPAAREETYIKLCFPVRDLAVARTHAIAFGGRLKDPEAEWSTRGFRACDGVDPEGNVVQWRMPAP